MRTCKAGVCNIGPRNRIGRLLVGIFFYGVGVWMWAFLKLNFFPSVTMLFLFVPFYLGFLGVYQALFGFCVFHSLKRSSDMR